MTSFMELFAIFKIKIKQTDLETCLNRLIRDVFKQTDLETCLTD